MQIWFLSNGSYSLKNCHNPFGKAIQPPPLTAKFRLNTENPYVVLPLVTPYWPNSTMGRYLRVLESLQHPKYTTGNKNPLSSTLVSKKGLSTHLSMGTTISAHSLNHQTAHSLTGIHDSWWPERLMKRGLDHQICFPFATFTWNSAAPQQSLNLKIINHRRETCVWVLLYIGGPMRG